MFTNKKNKWRASSQLGLLSPFSAHFPVVVVTCASTAAGCHHEMCGLSADTSNDYF